MPTRDLEQLCEIAARLKEDAALLRTLGMSDAADLLAAAEARLDSRVYAQSHSPSASGEAVCEPIIYHRPRAPRRIKGRDVRTH